MEACPLDSVSAFPKPNGPANNRQARPLALQRYLLSLPTADDHACDSLAVPQRAKQVSLLSLYLRRTGFQLVP